MKSPFDSINVHGISNSGYSNFNESMQLIRYVANQFSIIHGCISRAWVTQSVHWWLSRYRSKYDQLCQIRTKWPENHCHIHSPWLGRLDLWRLLQYQRQLVQYLPRGNEPGRGLLPRHRPLVLSTSIGYTWVHAYWKAWYKWILARVYAAYPIK